MGSERRFVAVLAAVALIFPILSFSLLFLLRPDVIIRLAEEDGPIEWLGAAMLLLAAALFGVAFFRDPEGNALGRFRTRRNLFFLFLALVCFVGFGEEISWGQRVFGFETPALLAEHNFQSEFNFHNLEWLHGKTREGLPKFHIPIEDIFCSGYFLALPLVNLLPPVGRWLRRLNVPVLPLLFVFLFVVHYAMNKAVKVFTPEVLQHTRVEIRETVAALLFVLAGMWFARLWARGSRRAASDPAPA